MTSSFVNCVSRSQPSAVTSDEILDPDAALPGDVDPGLDGDDVPGLEHVGRLRAQSRALVDLDPDAVAEAVAVCPPEPGSLDRFARRGIGVPSADAGRDGRKPCELRLEAERVQLRRAGPGSRPTANVRVQSEQ